MGLGVIVGYYMTSYDIIVSYVVQSVLLAVSFFGFIVLSRKYANRLSSTTLGHVDNDLREPLLKDSENNNQLKRRKGKNNNNNNNNNNNSNSNVGMGGNNNNSVKSNISFIMKKGLYVPILLQALVCSIIVPLFYVKKKRRKRRRKKEEKE